MFYTKISEKFIHLEKNAEYRSLQGYNVDIYNLFTY
jgi:hypothetical protein